MHIIQQRKGYRKKGLLWFVFGTVAADGLASLGARTSVGVHKVKGQAPYPLIRDQHLIQSILRLHIPITTCSSFMMAMQLWPNILFIWASLAIKDWWYGRLLLDMFPTPYKNAGDLSANLPK